MYINEEFKDVILIDTTPPNTCSPQRRTCSSNFYRGAEELPQHILKVLSNRGSLFPRKATDPTIVVTLQFYPSPVMSALGHGQSQSAVVLKSLTF